MKKIDAAGILFFVFVSIPLGVNLWKFLGRDYTLLEIWPHHLLDTAVMALFFFLLAGSPMENPVIYGALFGLFSVSFLIEHTPDSILGWIVTLGVLAGLGIVAFPRIAAMMPWVLLGLLVSYYGVLRTYLPELNRGEVVEILSRKSAVETGREFMRTVLGYERNAIGREKYRYFLSARDFSGLLKKAGRLHAQGEPAQRAQGISFLEWDRLHGQAAANSVVFAGGVIPCRMIEKDASGVALHGMARIEPFTIALEKTEDGTFRVSDFPESIQVTLVEKTVPQF